MTDRRRLGLLAMALGIVAACSSTPTSLCACSLPGPYGVAHGTVTAGGAPVSGARMRAWVLAPGCDQATARLVDPGGQHPGSRADGGYELFIPRVHDANTACVRVVAERAPGDTAFAQVPDFDVNGVGTRTPVDVAFP